MRIYPRIYPRIYRLIFFIYINMISSRFMTRFRYSLYGVIASVSITSLSVQAAGLDGVFGDYFTNMTTPCAPLYVLTGLSNTADATF